MEENGKLVSFVYADREVITEEDKAGAHIRYIRGHELLASDSERARTYYHYACDEMGSITDITDCDGTVLNHYAYDAFGNRTVEEETVENRFGFAGEMMDAVTGQYYLRARFYNPVIARFLSEDTYYGDGLNLYAYCHNNPVRYVDPSGHEGLICSKKYGELKKKEAEGGTLSEKEKRQIYEYEQNQKKSNGAGSDSKSGTSSSKYQKASLWERLTTRKAGVNDLHANPLDEFSNPRIGPSDSAVAKYIKEINTTGKISTPIEVQKLLTGGYEIVNGHHRWLAAQKAGLKRVPIRIKNYNN